MYSYQYPRPAVTTDCLIFGFDSNKQMHLLLVERANEPFRGKWAFPGGFLDMDETAETCAKRELYEETGLANVDICQLGAFSAVNRDPRTRTITIAYISIVDMDKCNPIAGDDAAKAEWFPIAQLPPLAFDHNEILKVAYSKLRTLIDANYSYVCQTEPLTTDEVAQLYTKKACIVNNCYN
ncbi:MAG: NUDIX hydrolase [Bacteroidales bacterium]|nr:NUDIX hydrolase [Bacteroidales bacterium]